MGFVIYAGICVEDIFNNVTKNPRTPFYKRSYIFIVKYLGN